MTNGPLVARVVLTAVVGLVALIARDRPEDFDDATFRGEVKKLVLRYIAGRAAIDAEEG